MIQSDIRTRHLFIVAVTAFIAVLFVTPAIAAEYNALNGVKGIKVVFDVSLGSPKMANVVFWAVQDVYKNKSVRSLEDPPQVAVVFRGPAVKLITSDHEGFDGADNEMANQFADMVRQMKKDGVKLEVCQYAVKVLGVDPGTILPEVDPVGNGFISIAGYQAQGYALVIIK